MDSIHVNWETLDALIIEFAISENLFEHSSSSSSSSSSSYQSRLLIRRIRRLLELGDVDSAIHLLRLHAPFVLQDHRLLFRLHKQKFIELLRKGTMEDRDSAIKCLRDALAPCALDAYPEAYEEFKHILLAFIYDKDDQTSPVADEWSEKRRFDIAGLMSSVLRAHLHAYDPVFSMAVRYLISIHKGFCFRQGISSPISDLTERLLLEGRDPAAKPQESLYEVPPFDEVDIQALAHAVELTRQGAVDSLRFAKGDLHQAFQNELCRMKLNGSILDDLVREYCVYRGIVDSAEGSHITSPPTKMNEPEPGCFSGTCSSEVEYGSGKHGTEISINGSNMEVSTETDTDAISAQTIEERYPSETSNHEDCSTSGTNQPKIAKVPQKSRTLGIGERNKRKRWRGRHEEFEFIPEAASASDKSSTLEAIRNSDKYEMVLRMKELASKGLATEVVEEINVIDPNFFAQNPALLFQLKQLEFYRLVKSGDHSSALKVASASLGPLAARDPALLKPLKETLLTLLRPNEETLGEGLPLYAIATSLQVAIARRLGIEEPRLMKIIRATLHTHSEWFKLQMCKDRFEGLLKIDSLKQIGTPLVSDAASKSNADTSTHDSSQVTVSSSSRMQEDGSSPAQVSSRDVVCDENAILKVMEFLALPRADAIHLLVQYNGNAETVIQHIFS